MIYGQICQNPETTDSFRRLHKDLVNMVIEWCKKNSVDIDEFYLHADGIKDSIPFGCWQPCTDSCLEMYTMEEICKVGRKEAEPYLLSM